MNILLPFIGFILLLVQVYYLKKKLSQSTVVFIAMIEGIIYGLLVYKYVTDVDAINLTRKLFSTFGYGYIDLLRMIVIPLVPTSIIVSFLSLEDGEKLKKLGFRTVGMFLATATIASLIGIAVATVMGLGNGVVTSGIEYTGSSSTVTDVFGQLRGFIPKSPIKAMADLNLVAVIVFALFIAIAASAVQGEDKEKVAPFRALLESFLSIVNKVTKYVINLTPYGVLGLTAYWFSYEKGLESISALGLFLVAVIIACLIHLVFTYGVLIMVFINKVNPIKFFKKAYPAMLLAFTSRSSAGTLTLTVDTCKNRLKVSEGVSNFVAPLGAVMNMDACGGLYPALVAIFAANAYGVELTPMQYVILLVVSILASLGTAGVPMGATIFTTITLSALGLPLDVIAIVAGIDFIVDMFRTSVNVTGDMVAAVTVGNSIGEWDRESFNE
ncbi:dicarboxylate/amino acid:cation symporter [Mycoplasmatota bacterium WC44]